MAGSFKFLIVHISRTRDCYELMDIFENHRMEGKICEEIAKNPNIDSKLRKQLSQHKSYHVRMIIAANKNLEEDIADKLSTDNSIYVRAELAANTKYKKILKKLLRSNCNNQKVIDAIVNRDDTESIIMELLTDEWISCAVLKSKYCKSKYREFAGKLRAKRS